MLLDLFRGHSTDHLRQLLQLVDVHAHHLGHGLLFLRRHGLEHLGQLDGVAEGFHPGHTRERIVLSGSSCCWLSRSSRSGRNIGHWLVHHFKKGGLIGIYGLEKFGLLLTDLGEYGLEHGGI